MLFYRRNENAEIMKRAARFWKFGQMLGITCLTFDNEPRVNPFLMIYVLTTTTITTASGFYSTFSPLLSDAFTSKTAAIILNRCLITLANVFISMKLNHRKYLKLLLELLQTPVQNFNYHGKAESRMLINLLYVVFVASLSYICFGAISLILKAATFEEVPLNQILAMTVELIMVSKIIPIKFLLLKLNFLILEKFYALLKKLKDILRQATADNNDMRITILELRKILIAQKNLRDIVYSFSKSVQVPMLLSAIENVAHFVSRPGELVIALRWDNFDQKTYLITWCLDFVSHFVWVAVAIEPFHRISSLDDEMNYALNDFLAQHLEEGFDFDGFEHLERAVDHRCTFPLVFNFLGIMNVNRGILFQMLGASVTFSILLIQFYHGFF